MTQGLILFAHGARAASWAAPFERLRDATQAQVPGTEVALAFLELMTPSLPDTVAAMVGRGIERITVVPVFLGQGGHLLRDLPALCNTIRMEHSGLKLHVVGAIGEDAGVQKAMTDYCVAALGAAPPPATVAA